MRRNLILCLMLCVPALLLSSKSDACTNVLVTKGASKDGSCMVSYAADSHWLYGELYFRKAAKWASGSMLKITEWDTYKPLGEIPQAASTYQTLGNMNEHQLIIGETTYGGREELVDPEGIMDYGSLIYITLQRARTAREAIATIVALANEYGYPSEGESFSIADPDEVWVMDLIGKGKDEKGIVWVARRVPDGYICAHANQSRITRFPQDDPDNCLFAPDVISFARKMGYFDGEDADFSFRDAYNPLDFGGARACEARAWAAFNRLCDGQFTYLDEAGKEVTAPATDWLDYAMGYDLQGEMPLFVRPARKITVKDVADVMRDHFEGTPMDMRTDAGAGGNALPYRWRPMHFKYDGKEYLNERAIATQQTGFWFVAQARGWLPDEIGGLDWFGCDDAATSYLTPIYASSNEVPDCFRTGNGDLLHYSPTSSFWVNNRVANACYKMYDRMEPVVRKAIDDFENAQMEAVAAQDAKMLAIYNKNAKHPGSKRAVRKIRRELTRFSVQTAQQQFSEWVKLEELLLVKFIDGNVKAQAEDGSFLHSQYHAGSPDKLEQPGYTEKWKEAAAKDNGRILEVR